MKDTIDKTVLKLRLEERCHEVAIHLLGPPNTNLSNQSQMRWGNYGSTSMKLGPEARGIWQDFELGYGGDIFQLIQTQLNLDFRETLRWAADFLGERTQESLTASLPGQAVRTQGNDTKPSQRIKTALDMWRNAVKPANTLVEAYLRNRGCWNNFLEDGSAIRFNPTTYMSGQVVPAMIALIRDAGNGENIGIHRTHLCQKTHNKGALGKQMLGRAKNGVVRLRAGGEGKGILLGEGIESTLSAICLPVASAGYVYATLSAGGMSASQCIPGIGNVTIVADNDDIGIAAAKNCADRYYQAGVPYRILAPPLQFNDFNDYSRNMTPPA